MIETGNTSLSPGAQVGRYEIREILGIGGFGITYKAWDTKLNRWLAIKEFLPVETALRSHHRDIVQAQENRVEAYQFGLQRFLKEARTLAQFNHPNIIAVIDYLQANNTAYLVMAYEQGQTLAQCLQQRGGTLPEAELKGIFTAVLTGLLHIHEQDYYHRDIKPSNIYLRQHGEPVLIDFGSARQAIGNRSRNLTSIVSPGYAPSEQYINKSDKLGPWSDLYSVGATLYRAISNREPIDAPSRQHALLEGDIDPLIPAVTIARGAYNPTFLQLIDRLLQPVIRNRPQTIVAVLAALNTNIKVVTNNNKHKQPVRSTPVTVVVAAKTKHASLLDKTEPDPERQQQPLLSKPIAESENDIKMLWVKPGSYRMGSSRDEPARKETEQLHRVLIKNGFYIGQYQVTQQQWQQVMGTNPSHFKGGNRPVEKVNWHDVQNFIKKLRQQSGLSYRLPTEAE